MSAERGVYRNVRRTQDRNKFVDTHELLKAEIYRQGEDLEYKFAVANTTPLMGPVLDVAPVAPVAPAAAPASSPATTAASNGIEDYYLYFDSLAKASDSDTANGELKFSITQLNNSQPINNLIQIQMLSSFYFQAFKNSTTKPDFYFFRRAYMQIPSLPNTQSVQTIQNLFHYEFEVDNLTSTAVKFTPVKDKFYFRQPINGLNEIIFRFIIPTGIPDGSFKRLPLMQDTLNVICNALNPATFTITGGTDVYNFVDADIATALPYVIPAPGIAVYISGIVSTATTAANNAMDPQGWYVTRLINLTTFEIAGLDLTTFAGTETAKIVIPKNRIAFQCRFSCIKNTITNYLVPTHV